jgi:hypothetical protein
MAVKVLRGINVSPRGNRFQSQNWVQSYAFGGWIYSTNGAINFGESPSEISLSITLGNLGEDDSEDFSSEPKTFDINKNDLKLGAPGENQESLFDIDVNGAVFNDYVLYSYDIDIQANQKILNVVFKDYSVILDKVYVGLIKRQGAKYIHRTNISGIFPIKCPDCLYSGDAFVHSGVLKREVDLGSYVGLNGTIFDNMAAVKADIIEEEVPEVDRNVYEYWRRLSGIATDPDKQSEEWKDIFNLNGGYVMLGTEDIPQDFCGGTPEIKYSFPELLWSLQNRGMQFAGEFPSGYTTRTLYYKQNYVGTLREVLNNWGSDFGINFFASGKTFVGMDITKPVALDVLTGIVDPNDPNGVKFDFTEEDAISSYKESYSLDNSYDQSVITYNTKAAQSDTKSKEVKRHVGYAPLHPMDLNYVSSSLTLFDNAFGKQFVTNSPFFNFETCDNDMHSSTVLCGTKLVATTKHKGHSLTRFDKWTNRTFAEMDISMALSKYNGSFRDIYAGSRVIDSLKIMDANRVGVYLAGATTPHGTRAKDDFDANFKALGFHPIARIMDARIKTPILTKYKGGKGGGGNSNDQKFFEVYLGYHFPQELAAITSVEKTMAGDMYKYGLLTQGIVNNAPYTIEDYFYNLSPDAGLTYGASGIKRTTYKHDYEPTTEQHPVVEDAPFKDSVPFYNWATSDRYTGAFYGELENHWGTTQEDFDRSIEFDDDECQKYSTVTSANEKLDGPLINTTKQSWDMAYFAPSFHDDITQFYANAGFQAMLKSLKVDNQLGVDQISVGFWNYNGEYEHGCKKLYVCIIPITQGEVNDVYSCHPNGRFNFIPSCHKKTMNKEMFMKYQAEIEQEEKEKAKEEIPSICDISVEQELCENALQVSGDFVREKQHDCDLLMDEALLRFDCEVNPTGVYRVGFHPSWIQQPNSRYLAVNIERNPAGLTDGTFIPTDENGNVYIRDLVTTESLVPYNYRHINTIITYPVSTPYDMEGRGYGPYDEAGRLYYGTMTTTVNTEIRTPESVEIHGEPVNKVNSSVSSFKLINNQVDPDLDPFLNADTNQFLSYMSIITGENPSSVATIKEYHDVIKGLNAHNSTGASEKIDIEIIGEATGIANIITPLSGLTSFSVVIGQAGIKTSLSFSSKPPTLPEQESILNKISARLPKR